MARKKTTKKGPAGAQAERPATTGEPVAPETHHVATGSFLPGGDDDPHEPEGGNAPEVRWSAPDTEIALEQTSSSSYSLVLRIAPLKETREPVHLPRNASPEQNASIVAAAIERAAKALHADGVYQHAVKEQREQEARDRVAGVW